MQQQKHHLLLIFIHTCGIGQDKQMNVALKPMRGAFTLNLYCLMMDQPPSTFWLDTTSILNKTLYLLSLPYWSVHWPCFVGTQLLWLILWSAFPSHNPTLRAVQPIHQQTFEKGPISGQHCGAKLSFFNWEHTLAWGYDCESQRIWSHNIKGHRLLPLFTQWSISEHSSVLI